MGCINSKSKKQDEIIQFTINKKLHEVEEYSKNLDKIHQDMESHIK